MTPTTLPRVRREGREITLTADGDLPARCIRCNLPATHVKRQKLRWHPARLYWLVPVGFAMKLGVLLYIAVALVVSKRRVFSVGQCLRHRRQHLIWSAACLLGVLGGVALMALARPELFFPGLLLCTLGLLCGLRVGSGGLRVTKLDDTHARLRGFGLPYLESISQADQTSTTDRLDWSSGSPAL